MARTVIQLENVSKYYRLGIVGGNTLRDDLNLWWSKLRGKENPLQIVGEKDVGNRSDEYIWALQNINLKIKQGEILGIIGANGSGKSTLLKILSRVTGPTNGRVKIKGRIGSLLEVGTGFHPELTGRENVYLNGAILGMRKHEIDRKFDEIVNFSGVEQYIDTPVKRYSSGMRVRLGFAVAAHLDPEILVVDEVLAVGDAAFQKKSLGKMNDVAGEGRTVLFVSHNMTSIEFLCKEIIVLNQGKINYRGQSEEGIRKYLVDNLSKRKQSGDISQRDRRGKGNIQFTSFRVENTHGEQTNSILCGEDVFFVFEYKAKSIVRNIVIGFGIIDAMGNDLITHYNNYSGQNISHISDHGEIKCKICNFPLNQGNYHVLARISSINGEEDYLFNGVGDFEVIEGDFFGTGKFIPRGKKNIPFLVRGDWYLNNEQIHK
ncbi:MAG: ABC transporter ATP-binding protein [Anaerolineaceae bacterium]|nr:ABC transporter ATP-binding protein [Anaerolineaceae bacterium]